MSRRKKIALALLVLLISSQAPFIYRRHQLGRLDERIKQLEAARVAAPDDDPFDEYAGVLHVHSSLGGHSPGTLDEIVAAAKANRLAFVVMTEHPSSAVNTAEATLRGTHDGIIFINGSELVAEGGQRIIVAPGFASPAPVADRVPAGELVEKARAKGRLSAVAYPEQVNSWDFDGYDGIEVYNLFTNTKRISYPRLFFDGLWSYWSYPELLFATFYERPAAALDKWDELNRAEGARLAAYAGNDSHANVGFRLGAQDGPGIQFYLDPYERSFRIVRNHVLVRKGTPPTDVTLLGALRAGASFIAFDVFGDSSGFRFTAGRGDETKTMGEEVRLPEGGPLRLAARTPIKGRILFFKDGRLIQEVRDTFEAEIAAVERGAYRVEVYLDELGEPAAGKPWIISNPIFVR